MVSINRVVNVGFSQLRYTVTVTVNGNGTVTKSPDQPDYLPGTVVTLTATPAIGYKFDGWVVDGGALQTGNTIQLTI